MSCLLSTRDKVLCPEQPQPACIMPEAAKANKLAKGHNGDMITLGFEHTQAQNPKSNPKKFFLFV